MATNRYSDLELKLDDTIGDVYQKINSLAKAVSEDFDEEVARADRKAKIYGLVL